MDPHVIQLKYLYNKFSLHICNFVKTNLFKNRNGRMTKRVSCDIEKIVGLMFEGLVIQEKIVIEFIRIKPTQ
jgi:hypothetical protein